MSKILKEAKRLHDLGFGIHWLRPNSKIPVKAGWTTGSRDSWDSLLKTYRQGYNVGVRLGEASHIKGKGYICVIDVDIKGKDERFKKEALKAVKKLTGSNILPVVLSGRGNGSRHFYCLVDEQFKTFNPAQSKEIIKYHSPSKKPSKEEKEKLTPNEIANGIRLGHAWEVSLYTYGRQVVLPPSIHPDSGKPYTWGRELTSIKELPTIEFEGAEEPEKLQDFATKNLQGIDSTSNGAEKLRNNSNSKIKFKFTPEKVLIKNLNISSKMKRAIKYGEGVTDRSAYLLPAAKALLNAGLTENQVLNVLTNPKTYLGACGFEHAKTANRARAAYWVYKYSVKKIVDERPSKLFSEPVEEPTKVLRDEDREAQEEEFDPLGWKKNLRRTENGKIKPTVHNLHLIVKNTIGEGFIKRDLFSYRDTYSLDTPWGGKKGANVMDEDIPSFKYWLEKYWYLEAGSGTIEDLFVHTAARNAFDPVQDWFNALPEWDGVSRLDSWLKDNFEAEGNETYLAEVFRKWMVAMVVRVFEPGAKFDWMPIFEGHQGVGKSSFGRLLCGDKYFLDSLPNLADKDSALALQGMLVVEMGELSHFRKNELEIIKGFLTRQVDKVRPPYGKRWVESPRRCVFFGTTNQDTYLKDESGNRRYKPVKVGRLDFEALERDRLQLFSEAKYLYDSLFETPETLGQFSEEAAIFERKIHGKKMVTDDSHTMAEILINFIEKSEAEYMPFNIRKFRSADLFEAGGPLSRWGVNDRNFKFAAKALRKIGAREITKNKYLAWDISHLTGVLPPHDGDEENNTPTKNNNRILHS